MLQIVYDDETIIITNFSAILILVQKIFRQCYVDASSRVKLKSNAVSIFIRIMPGQAGPAGQLKLECKNQQVK